MADHPDPEIMRLSLSDLALRIKIMKINLGTSVEDVLSRALDPPLSMNIQRAVASLIEVGFNESNSLCDVAHRTSGPCTDLCGRDYADGSAVEQATDRRSSRKIPTNCDHLSMPGPGAYGCCNS